MTATDPPPDDRIVGEVCAAWLGAACATAPLPATGFSGAALFAIDCPAGRFVLKSFAPGTASRAAWVHGLMRHLARAGVETVPALLETPGGETLVADRQGRVWELVEFIAGRPTAAPSAPQAEAAAAALARLHRAAATFPTQSAAAPAGLGRRIERAGSLLEDPWEAVLGRLPAAAPADGLAGRLREPLEAAISVFARAAGRRALERLAGLRPPPLAVQAVLRDVWAEHVLFAADQPQRVAGFVDFHAAGIDSPAADLARLLGSWHPPAVAAAGGLLAAWAGALDAYERERPLAAGERLAIPLFEATGVIFGLDNWFRWVFEERRSFPAVEPVLARVGWLLGRLPEALATLAKIPTPGQLGPV